MPERPDYLLISMLASPAAPAFARTLTRAQLRKWGYSNISDDACLITSELITNACAATPNAAISLRLTQRVPEILIAVWDSSDQQPRFRPSLAPTPDPTALSPERSDNLGGWGLPIIAALALEHGCSPAPTGGKWTWARLKS